MEKFRLRRNCDIFAEKCQSLSSANQKEKAHFFGANLQQDLLVFWLSNSDAAKEKSWFFFWGKRIKTCHAKFDKKLKTKEVDLNSKDKMA